MTDAGIDLIARERSRQVDIEGYTAEHDREHLPHELVAAALAYAVHGHTRLLAPASLAAGLGAGAAMRYWPWTMESFRFDDNAVRSLTKAGALIAAAIDAAQAHAPCPALLHDPTHAMTSSD